MATKKKTAKKKTTTKKPKSTTLTPTRPGTTGRGSVPDRLGIPRGAQAGTAARAAHRRAALAEGRKIGRGVDIPRVRSEAAQSGRLSGQAVRAGHDLPQRSRTQAGRELTAAFNQTNRRNRNYGSSAYSALDKVDARLRADRERQREGNKARKKATTAKKNAASQARRVLANAADRRISRAGEVAFRATGGNRGGDPQSVRRRVSRAAHGASVNAEDRISRRNTGQGIWERGYGAGSSSARQMNSRRGAAPKQARKKTRGKGK